MSSPATVPLLVEVGCEEIPARFLEEAQNAFGKNVEAGLREARLISESMSPVESYSTPRRLVVRVPELLETQPDAVEEILGPPARVGLDEAGKPTRAAESFAERNAVKVKDLRTVATPKGDYLGLKKTIRGRPAIDLLPEILTKAVSALTFPKSMYWLGKSGPRFVRPVRWLLALLGEGKQARVVPFEFAGVKSDSATFGNRVVGKEAITVQGFDDYSKKLRLAQVEFMPEQRRAWLMHEVNELLEESALVAVSDPWLETWVVNSTEWPKPLLGSFDEQFLRLPREVLVTVMRDHQKYFAVEDEAEQLQAQFVAVLNRSDDAKGLIRQGHERVLAARLADAQFFWDADQRLPLAERRELLARVTYQAELGSYADKVERTKSIAREICTVLEERGTLASSDTAHVIRAIELSKCDLTTQMVQEFTELQGVVGGLYAAVQGEPEEVHQAIYDHYKPAGLEDNCPRTKIGAVVALADKLDSVVSGFAIGQEPTGSSDPFALRRAGNGIVKVLVEHSFPIVLRPLIQQAISSMAVDWKKPQHEVFGSVVEFLEERLKYFLESGQGLPYDTVRAVLAAGWESPVDAARRAEALEEIRGSEDFTALASAAKRIKNILAKSATASDWMPGEVDTNRLEPGPEQDLFEAYLAATVEAGQLAAAGAFAKALERIATLRPLVDLFFDKVLVMAEDPALRENRLRLLGKLDALFSGIAQFAEMVTAPADVDASTSKPVTGAE